MAITITQTQKVIDKYVHSYRYVGSYPYKYQGKTRINKTEILFLKMNLRPFTKEQQRIYEYRGPWGVDLNMKTWSHGGTYQQSLYFNKKPTDAELKKMAKSMITGLIDDIVSKRNTANNYWGNYSGNPRSD